MKLAGVVNRFPRGLEAFAVNARFREENPPTQMHKHMVDGLVRIAKRHGYRMKRYVSPTFRIMANQAGEQLEIELLSG